MGALKEIMDFPPQRTKSMGRAVLKQGKQRSPGTAAVAQWLAPVPCLRKAWKPRHGKGRGMFRLERTVPLL